jgi:hypothetical protein
MADAGPDPDDLRRARNVLNSFRISEEVYLLGSLEKGVTVYGQQVRAHNLAWALWVLAGCPPPHRQRCRYYKPNAAAISDQHPRIAIVGGGIAGLTTAACILSLLPRAKITLFERTWDLCPLQQGCDSRWLHPRIYSWPTPGSRAPSASLPLLTWQEGRASDVAHQLLVQFAAISQEYERLDFFIGVAYLRISVVTKSIEWVGRRGIPSGQYVAAGEPHGDTQEFDTIVLAAGFGLEAPQSNFPTPSYWRTDRYAQPALDGSTKSYIVSGYGDGAIVDLCRLTLERFRQDRIIDELFGPELEEVENELLPVYDLASRGENIYESLMTLEGTLLRSPLVRLKQRLRKDTRVVLHLSGRREPWNSAMQDVFGPSSSFLNRLLVYLLYRSGAFAPNFDILEKAVAEYPVHTEGIVCRHGPQTMAHIESLFTDPALIRASLQAIRAAQDQSQRREWRAGVFCNVSP